MGAQRPAEIEGAEPRRTQRAEESPADVVIITALKDELDAVLAYAPAEQSEGHWARKRDRHGFPYHVRVLHNAHREPLRIAAAWAGEMGESAAATRAATLIDELSPNYLAMCGICAGKRGDTFLGDVIVADRVFSYDHGKLVVGGGEESGFFRDIETYNLQKQWLIDVADFARGFQENWKGARSRPPSRQAQKRWMLHALYVHTEEGAASPSERADRKKCCPGWKQILTELAADGLMEKSAGSLQLTEAGRDWVANDRLEHPDGLLADPGFRVHIGSIASGKTVRQDPELFARLRRVARKTIGVEMEAAAIGAVAEKLGRRSIIVKAVSDYADHEKDDAFRLFACKASAEFLLEFLQRQVTESQRARRLSRSEMQPVPLYPDEETRRLSQQLEEARQRKKKLQAAKANTAKVDQEILELRRRLREGGRLRAGGSLGEERFLLLESVGQGGFATVWKALDQKKQETVAIKVLHPNLAGADERRERFFRGARHMAQLQHPAVVRVLEQYGEDGGYYYFVMEYVTGGNFRQAVLDQALSQDRILQLILRIGDALALAHSRGIVHRDIKPANILLNAQGQPLLTDFDLVRALDTTGGTRTGALGTAAYAAPECMERPQDADSRADVYSLGMTTVFGLYGAELPFSKILGNREQFVRQLSCPEPIKSVLTRAISLEPRARHASAKELINALQQASSSRRASVLVPQVKAVDAAEEVTDPAPRIWERASVSGALALDERTQSAAETRAAPPWTDPDETKVPAPRASILVEVKKALPPQEPQVSEMAGVHTDNGLLKKIFLLLAAVAMAGGLVLFWPKLMKQPIDGMGIFVTVDSNPRVNVRVLHSDKCGSPEPVTDLGMTPLKGVSGAHIQDTLVLENKAQGIYAEEKDQLSFGEPGETKSIKREFRLGNLMLKVTPRNVGDLTISRDGQDLGKTIGGGAKLELMEGIHKLKLRGDKLKEPVEVEVNVKARDTTTEQVDVSMHM